MREEKRKLAMEHLYQVLKEKNMYEEKGGKPAVHIETVYPDYRDKIDERSVLEILESEDPSLAFDEWIMENYEGYMDNIRCETVDQAMSKVYPMGEKEETEIRDSLFEELYQLLEFELPYDHFMSQEFEADLMIDTGDAGFDYACNSPYPHYYGVKGAGVEKDSSLVWLASTQGFSKKALEKALDMGDLADPHGFLESIRQEVANETSGMNCLTFLVKMSLKDLILLNGLIRLQKPEGKKIYTADARPECGTLRISKDATCGFYDPWNGAGSVFEIELEKDIDLPVKYIRSCLPDSHFRWSVSVVYGMMDGAWTDSVCEIKGPEAA